MEHKAKDNTEHHNPFITAAVPACGVVFYTQQKYNRRYNPAGYLPIGACKQ
jgi:hypothetical protein